MTAVAAENDVTRLEMIDDADRVGLLANVAVGRPENLARGKQLQQTFFESPDQHHLAIQTLANLVVAVRLGQWGLFRGWHGLRKSELQ